MKYLIASDLHGSSSSAQFLIERFNELKCDKLILLGDILYHGPRNDLPLNYNPKEVIALLNPLAYNIIAINGNCDAEVDQMVLKFKLNITKYHLKQNTKSPNSLRKNILIPNILPTYITTKKYTHFP